MDKISLAALKKFCGDKDPERSKIKNPFSIGEFTYATNGHIAIRIPIMNCVPLSNPVTPEALFKNLQKHEFEDISEIELPEFKRTQEDCLECVHDCPTCFCQESCEICNGTGRIVRLTGDAAIIHGVPFDPTYISMIKSLPKPTFCKSPKQEEAAFFKFDGGCGILMPMSEGSTRIKKTIAC